MSVEEANARIAEAVQCSASELDLSDLEARAERDVGKRLADRTQAGMKVGAVERQIGRAIALLWMLAERDGGEAPPRDAIEQPDGFGCEGRGRDRVEHAKRLQ